MRVVHITSAHPPFDTRVFHKECRTLADAGHDVTLVVPGGPDDVVEGVRLVGIDPPRSRWERMTTVQRDLWRAVKRLDPDVVHFHDPDLLVLGCLLARRGRSVIYDSHEDVERQLRGRTWLPGRLRSPAAWLVRRVENHAVRTFRAVISAEPGGLGRFPSSKRALVQNYPLRSELARHENGEGNPDSTSVVFYVGDIVRARGACEMVDAIALLPDDLDVRLVLAGRINEPGLADELAGRPGWRRTEFVGFVDREELQTLLRRAAVGLVLMHPTEQYREATQPVKLFEYLGAGVPVVASDFDNWRPFVEEIDAGLMVDPTDVVAIAGAVEELVRDAARAAEMGQRGRTAVLDRWTWDSEATELLDVYANIETG